MDNTWRAVWESDHGEDTCCGVRLEGLLLLRPAAWVCGWQVAQGFAPSTDLGTLITEFI